MLSYCNQDNRNSQFLLIEMKVWLTPSDAAAYNNPGYCRGDNYRWCTTL